MHRVRHDIQLKLVSRADSNDFKFRQGMTPQLTP